MSDYQDMCEMFGLSAGDPDAIDKIIAMCAEDPYEDEFHLSEDPCDDCTCDDPNNCPKENNDA